MRRGAPLSDMDKKKPVVSPDYFPGEDGDYDPEGGMYDKNAKAGAPQNSSSLMSSAMDVMSIGSSLSYSPSPRKSRGSGSSQYAYAYLTRHSTSALRNYVTILAVVTLCLFFVLPLTWKILVLVFASVTFGVLASLWLSRSVLQVDDGTAEMRAVSDPIREGAEGFLHVQYTVRNIYIVYTMIVEKI